MSEARRRGEALLDMRRPELALEHLRNALAEDPHDGRAHCLLAAAYFHLDRYEEMLEAATAACAAWPGSEWPHRLRSVALRNLKRDGLPDALDAVALEPEEPRAHTEVAKGYLAKGEGERGLAAARHAVTLDPELGHVHTTLGDILLGIGRPSEAADAYRAALSISPDDAVALNNLAVARLRSNDREGVQEQFESALRMDPRKSIVRHNLLHTGPAAKAKRLREGTLSSLFFTALFAIATPRAAAVTLGVGVVCEIRRAVVLRRLSPATRALMRDERRARRRWWRPF